MRSCPGPSPPSRNCRCLPLRSRVMTELTRRLALMLTGPAPDDPRFTGEPVDLHQVRDEELGALLALAHRTRPGRQGPGPAAALAMKISFAIRERSPVLSPSACTELFGALAADEEPRRRQQLAAWAFLRCPEPDLPGLAAPAAILAREPGSSPLAQAALAKLAGEPVEREVMAALRDRFAEAPLVLAELAVLAGLGARERALAAEGHRFAVSPELAPLPDRADRLAAIGEYAAFARTALEAADARVAEIQAGRVPYRPEKAFTGEEADVVWRAATVALFRDEPWSGELLMRLLPGVAVAPTAAKTVPSQSACLALARAVETWPTPEAVAALRQAKRVVRHAGLAKKLDRLVRAAGKNLAGRPSLALRLPGPGTPTRAQLNTVARALEGGYALGTRYRYDEWAELVAGPVGPLLRRLVWDIEAASGRWLSVLPGPDGTLSTADGGSVPVPAGETAVRLWHPCGVPGPELEAWRDRVVALRLEQPFRQVFREHYQAGDGDLFAGHVVALRPLLGLAVREGWRLDRLDGELTREFGAWQLVLAVDGPLLPGAGGFGDIGPVRLRHREPDGLRPAAFTEAPAVLVSEGLRAVDLLVSVAAFGLEEDPGLRRDRRRWARLTALAERPLRDGARLRRAALERVLTGLPVSFGPRHVHIGPFAVHLATARVTRDGEPVAVEPQEGETAVPLPWLPYDERLLERVAHAVVTVAGKVGSSALWSPG
ncbi:DUF4132 domain-containing protein [Amycolatopsis rhizosphaerae]|uniref:DUF4132 domain-containing protein n=2 Tax=Amycolatopsis rhizosphaerae TaxID=2053003 RepID=A0A558CAC1_9PSEU|nr:DUF4132 domain-containing protein [Amycolatopsis rhizosphaerae]